MWTSSRIHMEHIRVVGNGERGIGAGNGESMKQGLDFAN